MYPYSMNDMIDLPCNTNQNTWPVVAKQIAVLREVWRSLVFPL